GTETELTGKRQCLTYGCPHLVTVVGLALHHQACFVDLSSRHTINHLLVMDFNSNLLSSIPLINAVGCQKVQHHAFGVFISSIVPTNKVFACAFKGDAPPKHICNLLLCKTR